MRPLVLISNKQLDERERAVHAQGRKENWRRAGALPSSVVVAALQEPRSRPLLQGVLVSSGIIV